MRVRDVCTSRKETVSEKCACDTESVYTPFLSGDVDHESYFFKKKTSCPCQPKSGPKECVGRSSTNQAKGDASR